MSKKTKGHLSLLLIMFIIFSPFTIKAETNEKNNVPNNSIDEVHLVLDTRNINDIPKNFRKSSDLIDNKNLNLLGLNNLNISGSAQFSEFNLPLIIDKLDTALPKIVIDLRQESHGFINGLPVSFHNSKNNANMGLTREEVLSTEAKDLASIKLNTPISFYNHPNEPIIPKKVQSEEELVKSKSLSYIRIPVTDGKIPTDDMVDYFVQRVKTQPKDTWLHFHCKAGIGRTTTFMIMYDMMKNYNKATADDIIKRQLALANFDESHIESFYKHERINFLQNFYKYCKENGDTFTVKWSNWNKNFNTNNAINLHPTTSPHKNTSKYIKNSKLSKFLYVIFQNKMTPSERTMISSLQGIVNNHCSSQIYTLNSSQPDYKIWLDDLRYNYKIPYKVISNP